MPRYEDNKIKTENKVAFAVVLLAFAVGILSQWYPLCNRYIISDDARQHIYWMQQFQNSSLFKDDLLTKFSKNYQPWGVIFLYYIFSFVIDPITMTKILPIVLFMLSSLYLFRLVRHMTNDYAGFLATSFFIISPTFLRPMVGGNPRAFAFPLLLIFLYYLVKRDYLKSSATMILQSLLHPMSFLLSVIAYLFTFIRFQSGRIFLDKSATKIKYFIIAAIISFSVLYGKYIISYDPLLGRTVTRKQMIDNVEYYSNGRYKVLYTTPVFQAMMVSSKRGVTFSRLLKKLGEMVPATSIVFNVTLIYLIMILFLTMEVIRKKLIFPVEIILLFISSIFMYIISDLFLVKLYSPNRYITYSLPLISLIISSVAIGQAITKIKAQQVKNVVQILMPALVFFTIIGDQNLISLSSMLDKKNPDKYEKYLKTFLLKDMSGLKDLWSYLNTLPEETVLAASPYIANNIPTFAQRKVFINSELSHCIFDNYWKTIKKRTFDFFDAYYSEKPSCIYDFCVRNRIDYLVVKKEDFAREYLELPRIYFEPFNSYVKNITKNRRYFALDNIPEEHKLFVSGEIFVIKKEVLNADNFKESRGAPHFVKNLSNL